MIRPWVKKFLLIIEMLLGISLAIALIVFFIGLDKRVSNLEKRPLVTQVFIQPTVVPTATPSATLKPFKIYPTLKK